MLAFNSCKVLIDIGFSCARETAPHPCLCKPEEKFIPLLFVEHPVVSIQIPHDHWNSKSAKENPVVIEAQSSGNHVEAIINMFDGAF